MAWGWHTAPLIVLRPNYKYFNMMGIKIETIIAPIIHQRRSFISQGNAVDIVV